MENKLTPLEALERIKNISMNKIRILSLAVSIDRETKNNMTLLGFVLLKDEVRKNVIEGINLVKQAGIHTIMITGDNKETAVGVAKEIDLIDSDDDLVITHDKLDMMTDEEIIKVFSKCTDIHDVVYIIRRTFYGVQFLC